MKPPTGLPRLSSEFAGVPMVLTGVIGHTEKDAGFEASLDFAERARDLGIPALLVDATPLEQGIWNANAHEHRGAVVLRPAHPDHPATFTQQAAAHAIMNGAGNIMATPTDEPEIPAIAAEQVSRALANHGVVILGRTQEARDLLPPIQQQLAHLGGWIVGQTHVLSHDSLTGPRGYSYEAAQLLVRYPSLRAGVSGAPHLFEVPLMVRDAGMELIGMEATFRRPKDLVAQELADPADGLRRYDEMVDLFVGLMRDVRSTMPRAEMIGSAVLDHLSREAPKTGAELSKSVQWLASKMHPYGFIPGSAFFSR
jgi:hypothetical protein